MFDDFDNYLSGLGLGGGLGLEHFMGDVWSLNATAFFRYVYFNNGVVGGENVRLSNPLSETALCLNLGVTYHFH